MKQNFPSSGLFFVTTIALLSVLMASWRPSTVLYCRGPILQQSFDSIRLIVLFLVCQKSRTAAGFFVPAHFESNRFHRSRGLTRQAFPLLCLRLCDNDNDKKSQRSSYPGISRREVFAWGPIIAAAISSAQPTRSSADLDAISLKQQQPFSSVRQYKTITLANGLRVLLVSDKSAIRSSAAFSIGGAGQFSDPADLPGLAHLMEHMVLSSSTFSAFKKSRDFEDWLSDNEGASNAFTGYEQVCFHFNSPPAVFSEALGRFASLFNEPDVFKVCRKEDVLRREIRRVASELNFNNEHTQSFYLLKSLLNPEHPYSRFSSGDIDTLERLPKEAGINVGNRLFSFFREHYQPSSSLLVVVSQNDVYGLERSVSTFSGTLSRERKQWEARVFPEPFRANSKTQNFILYRSNADTPLKENIETVSLHWALDLDYIQTNRPLITAPEIGFVVSQILGRRGPGSLYYILLRKGWIPVGNQGLPRISFPVDVSGFQLMKLEINLTLVGFINRAAIVSDIYRSINSLFSGPRFLLSRQILAQYAVVAQLHGHLLSPRPPDAIELAVDGLTVGIGGAHGVGTGEWRRFPLPNDRSALASLQKAVRETFVHMRDLSNTIIITTASDRALKLAKETKILREKVPFLSPPKWQADPFSGAKYYRDDLLLIQGIVDGWFAAKIEEDDLIPPLTNNLIPPTVRPPRFLKESIIDATVVQDPNWLILKLDMTTPRLPLPRMAPEPSCRCAFVFQLLSPRPARANTRQAAYAELWKISFEKAVTDLAELGAPAACAYSISFNKFGMRLCFLGISQNLASYARRFCRRLVRHHRNLLNGPESLDQSIRDKALYDARRISGLSNVRRRQIENILKDTTAYEAATEAIAFFKSCRGGCAFSQGDLLPSETSLLFDDLRTIFRDELGSRGKTSSSTPVPSINSLVYRPVWMPRFASSCVLPGVPLLSDACGRVPR